MRKPKVQLLSVKLFLTLLILSCGEKNSNTDNKHQNVNTNPIKQTIKKNTLSNDKNEIGILIIQCSNGYGMEYDFNPIIYNELKKNNQFKLIPFPYKKLLNVTYQGVYDKKYAKPIIEKIDADIFIMTKFASEARQMMPNKKINIGYEIKILNTKNLNQKISIGKQNLKDFKEIEVDIVENIENLTRDIIEISELKK